MDIQDKGYKVNLKKYLSISIVLMSIIGCGGGGGSSKSSGSTHTIIREDPYKDSYKFDFTKTKFVLFAWGELGMHCMDDNYSVFSLFPPYSTLKAQLIVKGRSPRIVSSGVTLTYEAIPKKDGRINTSSSDKTDFWKYVSKLFPGKNLKENVGLDGKKVQSTTPEKMDYNSTYNLFIAKGIPTVPIDDNGEFDPYTLIKVVAKNKKGEVLASTVTTLAQSSEMSCVKCHNDNPSVRMDILEKHDKLHPNAVKDYYDKLKAKGYDYNKSGLAPTAKNGMPILCVACHPSNAIANSGIKGIEQLTYAMHHAHANRYLPGDGTKLENKLDRNTCYLCHPGSKTKCLRGAMGSAVDKNGKYKINCQNCHGSMEAVANKNRQGWKDEPNCQACHHDTKRLNSAVNDIHKGILIKTNDFRFATERDALDANKTKLYKNSLTHGGVACAACHGPQHEIYPSKIEEENIQSISHQGYKGTIRECGVCHANQVVTYTYDKGPHGLHAHNQEWVNIHGTIVLRYTSNSCKACHGNDLKGTSLSKVSANRTFKLGVMDKYVKFKAGEVVGCNSCHQQVK